MYGDWGIRTIYIDMIIERINPIVTRYDGGDLTILPGRCEGYRSVTCS